MDNKEGNLFNDNMRQALMDDEIDKEMSKIDEKNMQDNFEQHTPDRVMTRNIEYSNKVYGGVENTFWEQIKEQTKPENILKTCYGYVNNINSYEKELMKKRAELTKLENDYTEIKRDFLIDKKLMARWKVEYNITNDEGRIAKINEELKDLIEDKENTKKLLKNIETNLSCNKRVFNLHLEVLKKTNNIKFPYEL